MNVQEFERVLKLGLGRAILHLQTHDATPYRDVILHACLHNISYDRQIEGGKTVYLWEILQLTGEPEFYRGKILEAAAVLDYEKQQDAKQTLEMVFRFAEEGDHEAKQLLYDNFTKRVTSSKLNDADTTCAWSLIEVDELKGFLFVAEKLGQFALNHSQLKGDSTLLIGIIEDLMGEEEATAALSQARQDNPYVDAYLKLIEGFREKRNSGKRKDVRKLRYSEIKRSIISGQYLLLALWGKFALSEDLQQAAVDLIHEDDPKLLSQYLRIFEIAPFPLFPEPLFRLAEHPEHHVRAKTYAVLKQISHPAVREFALKRIQENSEAGRAVDLLNRNFHEGDYSLIKSVTERKLEEDDHHHLQMSVRHLFEDHPDQEAAGVLLNLYEHGPCSFCRESTIEDLHSINALPDPIREECLYDSNLDIRKLAKNNFVPLED